jgi:hypothetical protein
MLRPARVLAALVLAATLAVACGDERPDDTTPAETPERTPTATAPGSQQATAVPTTSGSPGVIATAPVPATPTGPVSISSQIGATCIPGGDMAEITVNFSVRASNGGSLTRVRLIDNGAVRDDSGSMAQAEYRRIVTLRVPYGERHAFELEIESPPGRAGRSSSSVSCPGQPTATPGPRA